jgi:hypothetical protein
MTVDETFENVNRLWQEISVIVLIHAVALTLAIYAGLIPFRILSAGIGTFTSLPELATFRTNLQRIGLDLPLVVVTGTIVYIVLFQRFSDLAVRVPLFRLSYSQPALWRAGKCFDELRQLVRFFEGFTASTELTDLGVTLGLAVTQYAKDFQEHHGRLVDARFASAALWSRYYAGFCFLAFASCILLAVRPFAARELILPGGLLLAALITRCGWEAQIEAAVLGRLTFAIDCAIVSGAKRDAEQPIPDTAPDWHLARSGKRPGPNDQESLQPDYKRKAVELELAAALMALPPPCLPYQRFWVLNYVRHLKPFRTIGSLPLVHNETFREWVQSTLLPGLPSPDDPRFRVRAMLDRIHWPEPVPDGRLCARLFRSSEWESIGRWLFPRLLLVDRPECYWRRPNNLEPHDPPGSESWRKWLARIDNH